MTNRVLWRAGNEVWLAPNWRNRIFLEFLVIDPRAELISAPAAGTDWRRALLARLRYRFALKAVGTTAFISLFFVAYFHVLRHPAGMPRIMPLTLVDAWVSFQPAALLPYLSLWFYVGVPPALLRRVPELIGYALWMAALCLTGLLIFYWWPTAVPVFAIDLQRYPSFAVIQGIDAKGNACPSLHVATAMFSALWLDRLLRELGASAWPRAVNALWLLTIAWSTLATRQHVVLDVLAGLALGATFALPSLWRRARMASGRP